jgi:4-hydroxy-tetrahydrodipicolinate synthase
VSVVGHGVPFEMIAIHAHAAAGKSAQAEEVHRKLLPLFRALFLETNPAPVKHALMRLGFTTGDLRLPLVPVKPETAKAVDQALGTLTPA